MFHGEVNVYIMNIDQIFMDKNVNQDAMNEIVETLKRDCQYTKKIYTDIAYAKAEFQKANVHLDEETFKEMSDGYQKLCKGLFSIAKSVNQNFHTIIPFIENS